jgi:putative ATP-dependent endonuclease of OLD family
MRYVQSQRDLKKFINIEKKQLLRLSQDSRETPEAEADDRQLGKISRLGTFSNSVSFEPIEIW